MLTVHTMFPVKRSKNPRKCEVVEISKEQHVANHLKYYQNFSSQRLFSQERVRNSEEDFASHSVAIVNKEVERYSVGLVQQSTTSQMKKNKYC
ncbi:hypothetical protein TNCT_670581 [Trichonephila clavata]|uniref:Uncharacterized protein n=1 Tax=Trichonephila clavata TaxID=2740835 RepID=A0A8X6F9M0_TRICU|nr:hypothetical protein TNCT_670581 [Trichonephila clavata]